MVLFMCASSLLVAVLVSLLALYYWHNLSRSARLASNIPGPKPLPLIGNVLEFGYNTVDILKNFERLWREYGNTYKVWIGPHLFVVTSDRKYVEHFLSSNVNITKGMTYKLTEPWLGTGLLTSTGTKWKHHRKIITPTFHFKILDKFLEIFNANGNILIQKLNKKVNGEEFDIYKYVTLCALDTICETAMGVQLNAQNNSNSKYVSAVQGISDVIMKRIFSPWLFPQFLFNISELGRRHNAYLKVLHGTTHEVIANRKKEMVEENEIGSVQSENDVGQKKRLAFLDLLLQYTKEGANLTDEEIREEVDTFMFEGHDTTASGMGFCLLMLAKHPECQDKLFDELREIFGNSDREATTKDLQDMKYLDCVIKESLRIYPVVPLFGRRLDEDVHLDGLTLSQGTNILISPFLMNRNPEYFPEPEKFNPDRFSDLVQSRNPYTYIPFSAGSRNCIGQKYAMLEMKSTISKVVRNFKLIPSSQEIVLSLELVLRNQGGIVLKLKNRK